MSPFVSELSTWRWTWIGVAVAVVMPIYARESPKHALIFFMAGVLFALSARATWDSSGK